MPGPDPVTAMAEGHADPEPAFLEVLAEAIDRGGADLVLHGHAHRGSERGETGGGVPVRNVAWPVTGRPYTVFHFEQSAGHVSAPRIDHHDRTEARATRAVDT